MKFIFTSLLCCLLCSFQVIANISDLQNLIERGKHTEALICAEKMLSQKNDLIEKAGIHKQLAIMYFRLGNQQKAIYQIDRAIAFAERRKETALLAKLLNNKGIIYSLTQNHDSSLWCYHQALKLKEKLHDEDGVFSTYNNIGILHEQKGDFQKAITVYKKAKEFFSDNSDKGRTAKFYNNLGMLFQRMEVYDSANYYFNNALIAISQTSDINMRLKIIKNFMLLNKEQKQFEKALLYSDLYHDLKDSLYSEETAKEFLELETFYKSEQQAHTIALQEARLKKNSLFISFSSLTVVLLALLLGGSIYQYKRKKHHHDLLEKSKNQAFLNYIRGQETERMRIAYHLHDDLNHSLMSARISEEKDRYVKQAQETLDEATSKVFSDTIREFGLNEALVKHIQDLFINKIDVYYGSNLGEKDFPSWFEASVFKIVTNLIDCAIKTGATEMHLYVTRKKTKLNMTLITEKMKLDLGQLDQIVTSLITALNAEIMRGEELIAIELPIKLDEGV